MSIHTYRDLMSDMKLFTCSLVVVKSDVGVMNSPGYSIILLLDVSLVL